MSKYILVLLMAFLLVACGAEDETAPPTVLTLTSIGNKTVTKGGAALNFSITAIDPDNLGYSFESTGGAGASPYSFGATFISSTGVFNWDVSNVSVGSYFVTFSVSNSNSESDSEEIQITVQAQSSMLTAGETLYNDRCQTCHGTGGKGGSQTIIECIDSTTYNATINNGSMAQYANSWITSDKDAVLFYLNNIDPSRC